MGNDKQPYVRYKFEANIQDKGMSFVIRRAADTFLVGKVLNINLLTGMFILIG